MTINEAVERVERLQRRLHWWRSMTPEDEAIDDALQFVLARAKEPRVYVLGEEERKMLAELLENVTYELGEVRHYADPRKHDDVIRSLERQVKSLTAALALEQPEEPFTVDELKCLKRGLVTSGELGYSALAAKLRAYIEKKEKE